MVRKTKTKRVAAFLTAMAMAVSPSFGSVSVSAESDGADWGFDYSLFENADGNADETETSETGDITPTLGYSYDYSDDYVNDYVEPDYTNYYALDADNSSDYDYDDFGYSDYDAGYTDYYNDGEELEAEIGEYIGDGEEPQYEEQQIFYAASPKLAASGAAGHVDNKTYYISGFNATIFYRSDGSTPEYQYQVYGNSSYTHNIQTPPDVIVEPIGYCIQRNGNHTVPTQGLTRHTVSEIVAGNVAGVYMTQQQADALIRVLLHKSECYSYGASIVGRYYPGATISDIRPGMDSSVCKDYVTQQYCWGACQTDFANGWNSDVANWAYMNFTETCTGGQGYDINYYVSNNASQQNVIGGVFRGTQNNPADPYIDNASVTVTKITEDGHALGGARFTVYDDVSGTHIGDSIVGNPWTTTAQNPSHKVEGLNYGLRFILREESAPSGYIKATDTLFHVDQNGNVVVDRLGSDTAFNSNNNVFVVKNKVDKKRVLLTKIDEDNNTVSGAEFTVTDANGNVFSQETTGNGFFADLIAGRTYTIKETKTPDGYLPLSEDITFVLRGASCSISGGDGATATVGSDGLITIQVVNKKSTGTITVLKVDENNNNIRGAEFTLKDANGDAVETTATDFGFNATVQTGNTFTLTETKTPEHYEGLTDSIDFKVTSSGIECSSNNVSVVGNTLKVINNRIKHTVTVTKVDENNGKLDGATFTLADSDGKDVQVTANDYGFSADLNEGDTYTLTETASPVGYKKATGSITFTVGANGVTLTSGETLATASGFGIDVKNFPIDYKVTVKKVDADTNAAPKDITGKTVTPKFVLLDGETEIANWNKNVWTSDTLEYNKTYTIREVEAPAGYNKAADVSFKFNKDGTLNVPTDNEGAIVISDKKTTMNITKWDITNDKELAGATIQILDGETVVDEWVSTASTHTVKGLATGKEYTLRETSAPIGYSAIADTTFVLNEDGTVTTTARTTSNNTVLVDNSLLTVYVSKQDIANENELAGAQLQVLDGNGTVVDEWTSTTTKHLIKGIQPDQPYVLRETTAPAGYVVTTDISFKAREKDGKVFITTAAKVVNDDTIVVNNTLTEVKISKRAVTGEDELAGAKLEILRDGNVVESWTSSDTAKTIKGLETGVTYTLRETTAPDGYICVADTTFTISKGGKVTAQATQTSDGTIVINDEKSKVSISKTDITSGDEIAGATLQVLLNDDVVDEWTSTTSKHTIEGLIVGKEYTLREKTAPFGYIVTEDTTFHIENDGRVVTTGSTNSEGTIIINNTQTRIAISKVDITNDSELAGATLQIIDNKGAVVAEWVSTTTPREIIGLGTGIEYTLRETIAPKGYTCATDTKFTINEHGEVSTTGKRNADSAIVIENRLSEISISKVDITTEEELEGATLQVIDSEGNIVEEWTSTKDAHVIKGLETGKTFTLRETVAPEGYLITTDTTFVIKTNGDVEHNGSVVSNHHIMVKDSKASAKISKVDDDDLSAIAGAKLEVVDKEGNVVDSWTSTNEVHTVNNIKTNTEYTIRETEAPKGYVELSTPVTFTVDSKGKVTSDEVEDNTVLVCNIKTLVEISKVDIVSKEEVAGATLQVIETVTNGDETTEKVVEEWVSTTEKHTIRGLETEKEYILRETVAPNGYTIATDSKFTIHKDNSIETTAPVSDKNVLLVEDTLTKVNISKVDITTKKELAGAKLQILDADKKVVEEWTSDDTVHTIEGLVTGVKYTIRETVAPAGYLITTDITFTIGTDGSITASAPITENGVILVEDSRRPVAPQPQEHHYTPVPVYPSIPTGGPTPAPVVVTPPLVTPKPVEDVSSGAGLVEDGEILL